jgi:guanosine-diphosphatase
VLDLGGASTQIVFEPVFDEMRPDSMLEEGEHKYDLEFAGKKRVLYQHSYLGYGLMKARESVHSLVEFLAPVKDLERETITNPCLARGTMKEVNITNTKSGVQEVKTVKMDGADVGSFEACNRIVQLVMAKDT